MIVQNHQHTTDQELLEKYYTDRNNKWLGILLERYTLLLFGVCMKYLKNEEKARDSVQQIFLKIITELEKYRVEYFKSWIYMVAKNHCLMQLRDKPGKRMVEFNEKYSEIDQQTDPGRYVKEEKMYGLLEASLKDLSDEQKQCVILFYLEKKSYQQISDQTGYNLMQVKSYIQNGKRNLKILIEKKMDSNQ